MKAFLSILRKAKGRDVDDSKLHSGSIELVHGSVVRLRMEEGGVALTGIASLRTDMLSDG